MDENPSNINRRNLFIFSMIALVLVLAAGGVWYYQNKLIGAASTETALTAEPSTSGGEIEQKVTLRPARDLTTGWETTPATQERYSLIDEPIADDNDYIKSVGETVQSFSFKPAEEQVNSASSVEIYFRAKCSQAACSLGVSLSPAVSGGRQDINVTPAWGFYKKVFPVNWTTQDLNALQVSLQATAGSGIEVSQLFAVANCQVNSSE